jgi:hypothetical protein
MKKLGIHTKKILKKMCTFVDCPMTETTFLKPGWFQDYYWTTEEEDLFKEWLIKYLTKSLEARKEIMRFPYSSKTAIRKTAEEFLFQYGWTVYDI